ncbi:MAG: hypothetical protein HY747_11855 [Elusimicrobia bacterium]|nr:hypothetical protein [Elusimicrobiota bacterium]
MIVLDASTLILLAKTDLLVLLAEKTKILITEEVRRESQVKPDLYDAQIIRRMVEEDRIKVIPGTKESQTKPLEKELRLDKGGASSLLLARDQGYILGTDDGPAIKAAKILGVEFFTAIHVLVELSRKGRLQEPVALAKLEQLELLGRYNPQILRDARERIIAKER